MNDQQLATLAAEANEFHQEGEQHSLSGIKAFWECGRRISMAKDAVPHGKWLPWLKANCPKISERRAQRYMRLAKNDAASDLEGAWRILNGKEEEEEEEEEVREFRDGPADLGELVDTRDERVPVTVWVHWLHARRVERETLAYIDENVTKRFEPPSLPVEIEVEVAMADDEVNRLSPKGKKKRHPDESHYDPELVIGGPADPRRRINVRRTDGTLLLALRRRAVPRELAEDSIRPLKAAAKTSGNRKGLHSQPIGPYDHDDGIGPTAFMRDEPERYALLKPLVRFIDQQYRLESHLFEPFQRELIERMHGTCFTTGSANWNAPTHFHRDKGNAEGSYSAQVVFRCGEYTGGLLVFPRYRLAVDLGSQDLMFFDGREMHGNTEIEGEGYSRFALICYKRGGLTKEPDPIDWRGSLELIGDEI